MVLGFSNLNVSSRISRKFIALEVGNDVPDVLNMAILKKDKQIVEHFMFVLSLISGFYCDDSVEYNVSYVYHAMYAYFDRDDVALKGLAK